METAGKYFFLTTRVKTEERHTEREIDERAGLSELLKQHCSHSLQARRVPQAFSIVLAGWPNGKASDYDSIVQSGDSGFDPQAGQSFAFLLHLPP